jgi:MYXO-CTERM domain-containing protein
MASLSKRYLMSLLALPLVAVADPIAVTSRSSGLMAPNPITVFRLGIELPDDLGEKLPYQLTISSTFDTDTALYSRGIEAWNFDSEVSISLSLGTKTYHYDGTGTTALSLFAASDGTEGEEHEISFVPPESPSHTVWVSNYLSGLAPSAGLWAPRYVHLGADGGALTRFDTLPNDPEVPGYLSVSTNADTMSLQLVSAVPEPGSAGMLAAGVFTLGLWRQYRRRAGVRTGQLHCIKQGGTSSASASTR